MPKGRYRKYIFDKNTPIPKTTAWRMRSNFSNRRVHSRDENNGCYNPITEKDQTLDKPQIPETGKPENNKIDVEKDFDDTNNYQDNNDNMSNDNPNILSSILKDNGNLNEMELAIAVLVTFFNGNLTQSALEDILNLLNLATEYCLPNNFNQLSKLIMKETDDEIKYGKKWYCDVCVKTYDKLDRYTRKCSVCDSKYF